jgi:hypothetical protein
MWNSCSERAGAWPLQDSAVELHSSTHDHSHDAFLSLVEVVMMPSSVPTEEPKQGFGRFHICFLPIVRLCLWPLLEFTEDWAQLDGLLNDASDRIAAPTTNAGRNQAFIPLVPEHLLDGLPQVGWDARLAFLLLQWSIAAVAEVSKWTEKDGREKGTQVVVAAFSNHEHSVMRGIITTSSLFAQLSIPSRLSLTVSRISMIASRTGLLHSVACATSFTRAEEEVSALSSARAKRSALV